jgi:hypothetical protein
MVLMAVVTTMMTTPLLAAMGQKNPEPIVKGPGTLEAE